MITDEQLFDLVLMNDDVHFHKGKIEGRSFESVVMPYWKIIPAMFQKNDKLSVEVRCPICQHLYTEASKRLKKKVEEIDAIKV